MRELDEVTMATIGIADDMAKCLWEAMQPLDVGARARLLRAANTYRERYDLARDRMRELEHHGRTTR